MTVYELIKADIEKLGNVRVPMNEPMIHRQIFEVLMDLQACAKAIEDGEKKAKEPAVEEPKEPALEIVPADEADVEE